MEHDNVDQTKESAASDLVPPSFAQTVEQVRSLVGKAVARRRQAIVYALARKISQTLETSVSTGEHARREVAAGGWMRIESLSQLRAVVGGRFQNLKQKWVSAGFPLREHRGDRVAKAAVSTAGWVDLSVWINRQGYETRLAEESDPWLFEVRKLS